MEVPVNARVSNTDTTAGNLTVCVPGDFDRRTQCLVTSMDSFTLFLLSQCVSAECVLMNLLLLSRLWFELITSTPPAATQSNMRNWNAKSAIQKDNSKI